MSAKNECHRDLRATLSGGNPRSLGRTDEVVECVTGDRNRLDDLFDCVFDIDETVRMRAGDALEKVCREHLDWLQPYTDRILTEVAAIPQPSVQWHVVQMIGELPLNDAQRAQAVKILKHNLESASDWIVLNDSLEVFARFVRADPSLQPYFMALLRKHAQDPRKSVANRATKLLSSF